MPRKPVKTKEREEHADLFDIDKVMDSIEMFDKEEKAVKLTATGISSLVSPKDCISSGVLCGDLIIGGGIPRGRIVSYVGPEHGGKTTGVYQCFREALKFIPRKQKGAFFDIEGVVDPKWFGNVCGYSDMNEVFGKKSEDGTWLIEPQIRNYKPAYGEQALRLIKRILHKMPNKVLIDDKWYYEWVAQDAKKAKAVGGFTKADLQKMLKGYYSKKLLSKFNTFLIPITDNYAGPEMLIGADSWAAMTPEAVAEDDTNQRASQASMFSKYLNDIKSLVGLKGCSLVGVNQIRQNPGQQFGNPEYYPGGSVLKHIEDTRIRTGTLSNQHGSGMIEEEGSDKYRHFKLRTIKNKLFIPHKEAGGRFWMEHNGDTGFGTDPVLDVLNYLKMTGQFKGTKKGFVVNLKGKPKSKKVKKIYKSLADSKLKYDDFKSMILNPNDIDLREECIRQIRRGFSQKLYLKNGIEKDNDDIEVEDEYS